MTDFNPLKLIEDSVKAGFDPAITSEVDDRQLPWAKNVCSWTMDTGFLNIKEPFPLQLQMMLRLFGDVCAYCSDWEFYQTDWQVDQPLDDVLNRIQLLDDGKCPKCRKTRLDQYNDKLFFFPDEIDLLWGMRSSKSSMCGGMIGTYVLHRYLRLPDPAVYFGQLPGTELYMRFVAMTLRQAKQSNWMQFTGAVRRCDWFNQYHDFMSYFSRKQGIELVRWVLEGFAYVHKSIVGYCVGAMNYDVERGRAAAFTSIDEIGLFEGDLESTQFNPHETYTTYEKSSATIRSAARKKFLAGDYNSPTAVMAVHSSTKSKSDYIMRLVKLGKTNPVKLVSHKASWEVNPGLDEEFLAGEKLKDPRSYDRDYGSIPPFADEPFIESYDAVIKTAVLEPRYWNIKTEKGPAGGLYLNGENIEDKKGIPYLLSIDMGRSECGYALTLLKLKEEDFSVVQLEAAWSVYVIKPSTVDFDSMFNKFVLKLCEKLYIKMVVYDQWQSTAHIDALNNKGIEAMQYSMAFKDFLQFRSQLYQGKIETCIPEMEFSEVERSARPLEESLYTNSYLHLLWQMLSVSECGHKITKGSGHDDLFRAFTLGCHMLWDAKYRKSFEYKGGVALHVGRSGSGGLVLSGGSRSGAKTLYTPRSNNAGLTSTVAAGRSTLGSFMGRTRK